MISGMESHTGNLVDLEQEMLFVLEIRAIVIVHLARHTVLDGKLILSGYRIMTKLS